MKMLGRDGKKNAENEIELAKKGLIKDIEEREKDAKAKLDDLLDKKHMEFCTRCKKKISSRTEWAGKCLWEGCDNLICRDCWDAHKYRFCAKHAENVSGSPETGAKKKETFGDEDPDIKIDLKSMLDKDVDSRSEKLDFFAAEYARWLEKRMEKYGTIDWKPDGWIKEPRLMREKKDGEHVLTVYTKSWFRKKPQLSVVVSAFDAKGDPDTDSLLAYLRKASRKHKGHTIFVLVEQGSKMNVINFINKLSDSSFSVFMTDPRKGDLHYNINDGPTASYSLWFSQKREPLTFRKKLKKAADMVSGKLVVSEKQACKEFGFSEKDVHGVLKKCGFLEHIKETDTFFFRKD